MSKYDVQKKVIAYLEEHYIATRREIFQSMPEHPKNSVYRAIQRLKGLNDCGVIVDAKQKMLIPPSRHKSQIPENIRLNMNHPKYIKYKNKKGDSTHKL